MPIKGRNIVILQEMKAFLSLMFFKGALLEDSEGVLEEQGLNSRSERRICFTSVEEVVRLADTVGAFVEGAVEVEKAGKSVGPGAPRSSGSRNSAAASTGTRRGTPRSRR